MKLAFGHERLPKGRHNPRRPKLRLAPILMWTEQNTYSLRYRTRVTVDVTYMLRELKKAFVVNPVRSRAPSASWGQACQE